MALLLTTEGFYITGDDSAMNLKQSEMNPKLIHEFMLSEDDGNHYNDIRNYNDLKMKMCMSRMAFLRNLALTTEVFEFLPDIDESEKIVLSKNGVIVLPHCVPI